MAGSIIEEIEREYRLTRERNAYIARKTLDSALADTEFKANYNAMKDLDFEIAKAENFDGDLARAGALRTERDNLLKARKAILARLGLDERSFSPPFTCADCRDTGYISGVPCRCFREKWQRLNLARLGVEPTALGDFSLDTKSAEYGIGNIYDKMKNYVAKFPDGNIRNFLFMGQTGCGKTFLASAIAGEVSKRGFNVIFLTAMEMNEVFLRLHLSRPEERLGIMSALYNCDLLVIDDLGTENLINNVTVTNLLSVASERFARKRHTIITTNLTFDEIIQRYNDRFFSRITEKTCSRTVRFPNVNFRTGKKEN